MKKMFRKSLLLALVCTSIALSSTANATQVCHEGEYFRASDTSVSPNGSCVARTPDQVWTELLAGNAQYVSGDLAQISTDSQSVPRQQLALQGQKPEAIILTCSDSRLTPETLFNAGLGRLFVVRVAGNIINPHELGSIEYAVEHLGTRLIVVLGHEKCGAVKAAYDDYPAFTHAVPAEGIGSLIDTIKPAVISALSKAPYLGTKNPADPAELTACVQENINLTSAGLKAQSDIIKEYIDGRAANDTAVPPVEAIAAGSVKIYSAYYKLDTGVVTGAPAP